MNSPKDQLKDIVERFGWEGLDDLMMVNAKTQELLQMMLMITTIAHNLYVVDHDLGIKFLERFNSTIEQYQNELGAAMDKFTWDRGEL